MSITFTQLNAFAAVARNGSVKAAASELAVSEAAVSLSVGALRDELGDDLYRRHGRGVELTTGGRELYSIAIEMLGLEAQAHRLNGNEEGPRLLRVAASRLVAEHAAPPLFDAFATRAPDIAVALQVDSEPAFADLLISRRADLALGARPPVAAGLTSKPFLRYRLVVVAAPGHRLAGKQAVNPAALARETWAIGPDGIEPDTPGARFFAAQGIAPADVRVYPNESAAVSAAAAGHGLALAVAHAVVDEIRRRTLVRIDLRGAPFDDLWYVTTLADERCPAEAATLRRYAASRDAVQAMLFKRGVAAGRVKPVTHTTLWSSVRD